MIMFIANLILNTTNFSLFQGDDGTPGSQGQRGPAGTPVSQKLFFYLSYTSYIFKSLLKEMKDISIMLFGIQDSLVKTIISTNISSNNIIRYIHVCSRLCWIACHNTRLVDKNLTNTCT